MLPLFVRRRSVRIALAVAGLIVLTFLVAEPLGVEGWMSAWVERPMTPGVFVLLVVGLLTADVVLPVPSSLVVGAAGTALGFTGGSLASLVGLVLGSVVGYGLGMRLPAPPEPTRQGFWALVAVAFLRCVPVAAETSAIVAGRERLPFGRFVLASTLGSVPFATVLAYFGSRLIARG